MKLMFLMVTKFTSFSAHALEKLCFSKGDKYADSKSTIITILTM